MITWNEVAKTHCTWRGVSVKEGRVVSLLCNQHKDGEYCDAVFEDRIEYAMPSTSHSGTRKALEGMVGSGLRLHVFEKLGKNAWRALGEWIVTASAPIDSETTIFELKRPPMEV